MNEDIINKFVNSDKLPELALTIHMCDIEQSSDIENSFIEAVKNWQKTTLLPIEVRDIFSPKC